MSTSILVCEDNTAKTQNPDQTFCGEVTFKEIVVHQFEFYHARNVQTSPRKDREGLSHLRSRSHWFALGAVCQFIGGGVS